MTTAQLASMVAPACRAFHVKRLSVFGSMARSTETPESDVDLLVELDRPEHEPARRFFGLKDDLEARLGRQVDLLTVGSLRNPYFRARVESEMIDLYEA